MLRSSSVSIRIALGVQVELRPPLRWIMQPREVAIAVGIAAVGRGAGADLRDGRAEALAKNDVHDLLVGAIAVFERDLLRQDLDPLDCFGRNVAKLAEARDPLAVEQQHRPLAAAALGAADLRRQRVEQFVDVRRAGRPDVASVERVLRRDIADHRPRGLCAGNDDLLFVARIVGLVGCGRRSRALGCRGSWVAGAAGAVGAAEPARRQAQEKRRRRQAAMVER